MNAPTITAIYLIFIIISFITLYGIWLFVAQIAILLNLSGFNFWLSSIVITLLSYSVIGSMTYRKIADKND
jgi:membrane protein implicated in regulation of membrane protease activity